MQLVDYRGFSGKQVKKTNAEPDVAATIIEIGFYNNLCPKSKAVTKKTVEEGFF